MSKITKISDKVTHWKQLQDKEYLGHWDIPKDKDVPVVIDTINFEEIYNPASNETEIKPVLTFIKGKKRMIANATNMDAISSWHGVNPHDWFGKEVTIYRTDIKVRGEWVECLRIKNKNTPYKASKSKGGGAVESTKDMLK